MAVTMGASSFVTQCLSHTHRVALTSAGVPRLCWALGWASLTSALTEQHSARVGFEVSERVSARLGEH